MAFGETSNKGAPPPVVKLNGYGSYVLNNVPVVVTNFTYNLENGVDYIRVPINVGQSNQIVEQYTWVPTSSMLSVTCTPTYSRTKASSFSLDKFINGDITSEGYL